MELRLATATLQHSRVNGIRFMKNLRRVTAPYNDEKLVGWVLKDGRQTWIHFEGETFVLDESSKARRGKKAQAGDSAEPEIRAPMPGRVTKLLVARGEEVQSDQVVIMMEAMKMEYSLKAKLSGTVENIACKAGDTVTLGQTLLVVKPILKK